MTEQEDFPAAHSMDTMWFAVDRDGHVALFDSGEAGAVPTDANLGEDYFGLLEELGALQERSEVEYQLDALVHEGAAGHCQVFRDPISALLFLRDTAGADALVAEGRGVRVPTSDGVGVIVNELDQATHAALHQDGACLGCCWHYEEEDLPNVGTRGLFRYEHSCENWAAGPYVLGVRPRTPVRAADVPAEVIAAAARYEGSFAETKRLQPAEVWPSDAWSAGYLSLDGKTMHPFPGREDEYAEEMARAQADGIAGEVEYSPVDTPPKKPWYKRWFS